MSIFGLMTKSAWRQPLRTVLLMVCIAVAMLIHGLTSSFLNGTQGTSAASEDVLGVMSASGRTQRLPMAHLPRIIAHPDVAQAAYIARLRGFVDVEKNVVSVSATDPGQLLLVAGKSLGLTQALVANINQARDRVLVGRALAKAQEWTVGQRVTLTALEVPRNDGSRHWRFEIAGIFDGESASTDTYFMIARYDYVNAARATSRDTVDAFVVRARQAASSGELAAGIDALFANSAAPTRTQSEKQFLEAFLRQYADVGLIIDLIVSAAFITLLMIIGNTLVFAVRERTVEIGVLKTLGFSHTRILGLILGETLFIFTVGGCIGLALTKLATMLAPDALGLVFSPLIIGQAVIFIVVFSLVTGIFPAVNAMRISVSSAFRTR